MSTKSLTKEVLKARVKDFATLWQSSLKDRYDACCVYYNTISVSVSADIEFRKKFPQWSPKQWRMIWEVGKGILIPQALDFRFMTLVEAFAKIPIALQKDIYTHGVSVYKQGEWTTVKLNKLTGADMKRVVNDKGEFISADDQIANDQKHSAKPIMEMLDTGFKIHKAGIVITKEVLRSMLLAKDTPFTKAFVLGIYNRKG